jgi:hypothetical protein
VTSFRESWPLRVHLPEALELTGKTIVIVNGPANFFAAHFPLERDAAGLSVPAIMRVISPSVTAMTVERPSEQMLRLSAQDGWLANPLDLLSRSLARPFVRGDRVDLGDVRVDDLPVQATPGRSVARLGGVHERRLPQVAAARDWWSCRFASISSVVSRHWCILNGRYCAANSMIRHSFRSSRGGAAAYEILPA